MAVTPARILKALDAIAPFRLAESWDNVGLQVGRYDQPVKKIWVALDPLQPVVAAACDNNVDLLVTHHPLIFKPLKALDIGTPLGAVIHLALTHQLAVISAHTNMDSARGGLNDQLALRIGLKNLTVLGEEKASHRCKLVVYVPVDHKQALLEALFKTPAGKIGEYSCCSFRSLGKGTFRPGSKSAPRMGNIDEIAHVDEFRVEAVVQKWHLPQVIEQLKKHHPYEEMAYDVYPLVSVENRQGLGRVGDVAKKSKLADFVRSLKECLGLDYLKVAGRLDLHVSRVALCTGSGSGMMGDFLSSDAQVFISGDLHYHDARAAEAAGRAIIDIGHFASEHLIVDVLLQHLKRIVEDTGQDVTVQGCDLEAEPFTIFP